MVVIGVEVLFWELDIIVVVGDNEGQDQVSPTFYASRISARTNHGFEGSAVNRGYCQGFTGRTPAWVRDGFLAEGT